MTEEEKKAIEDYKRVIAMYFKYSNYDLFCSNLMKSGVKGTIQNTMADMINLIEKLQKENEKWKENARIAEENDTTLVLDVNQACKELGISEDTIIADELADKIKEKYILKDKIREKIEDLKKEIENNKNNWYEYFYDDMVKYSIKLLEKLLKEEQE